MPVVVRSDATIIIPCYNEGQRLDGAAFQSFAASTPDVRFVFVNDGSTDDTAAVLQALVASKPASFEWISHERNRGKAEAVRSGILHAAGRSRYVGYWDADLATPLSEIPRFVALLEDRPELDVCLGARVRLLGRHIQRRAYRHYVGRIFATAASLALQLPVYDTQCGAKLFRSSPEVQALFAEPFVGRWTFDIELIARLMCLRAKEPTRAASHAMYELPLNEWRDAPGSKVNVFDLLTALLELRRIRRKYFSVARRPQHSRLAKTTTRPSPARSNCDDRF